MKAAIHFLYTKTPSGKLLQALLGLLFVFFLNQKTYSQCSGGYYQCTVNWDNLDYLITTGNYSGFVTSAMSETQKFAIGTNYLTINRTSGISTSGENATHTGDANSYGTGEDVSFTGDGTITLTFNAEVQNVQFSLYDIDRLQSVTVTAVDASSTGQTVTMTTPSGSILTITGSPGLSPNGYDPPGATSVANTSNSGTLNISIAGPVKTVTIVISTSDATKDFWLSDITACVAGIFSDNYLSVMQPYTGQSTYILATSDTNTVSYVNITTGEAKMLFQDVTCSYMNSLTYDPVNHNVYYVPDFTGSSSTNKTIKKYNVSTQTISTVVADITTLGLPTFDRGVESAGAAFYDGELYIGIEGIRTGHNGNRETIIWRINFDGSGNALSACQVYGTLSDNGSGTNMHDWNDFVIVDSMLIDFNGAASASARYTHLNLRTGVIDNSYTTGNIWNRPRQTAVTWNEQIYWVHDSLALYNGNGTIGSRTRITGATVLDWKGFAGDATGFRPPSDFGDAPASYDTNPLSPALHMKDTTLRLGATFDEEFAKQTSANASGDGSDEDGIATVTVLDTATTNYFVDIQVYNNSGSNATLIGWLDIDGDGVFEASEAQTATVSHGGPVLQTIRLTWVGINTPLSAGQTTFLRIRLTSASNGMTANDATGYFSNGEVEDYPVYVAAVLPVKLISFDVKIESKQLARVYWNAENEIDLNSYEVQKSKDGLQWQSIGTVTAKNQPGAHYYEWPDFYTWVGKSYYRLRMIDENDNYLYSRIVTVSITPGKISTALYPNPVDYSSRIIVNAEENTEISLKIFSAAGVQILSKKIMISAGENKIPLETMELPVGIYFVQIETRREIQKLRFVKKELN